MLQLKGMTTKDARKEAEELMQRLELKEKKNMFGNQLSGGMKRKLCLAIALIGGSKVRLDDWDSDLATAKLFNGRNVIIVFWER